MARSARLALVAIALTLCLEAPSAAAPSTTAEPSFVTNGQVDKVLRTPTRTFLGGDFDYIGPPTGFGTVLNSGGSVDASYPVINGPVKASVQDGSGGYFIGGEFTRVGSADRDGLAHILQNGTVDPSFNPDVTLVNQGGIRAMSRSGTRLYIAGSFTHVNGTQRGGVALLDTTNGALSGTWNPTVGTVNAIVAQSNIVYLGGTFTTVNGTARKRLAAVDETDASTVTGFVADLDSDETSKRANALLLKDGELYVAGAFGTVNNTARPGVAAVSATTGALDTTFAPTGLFDFQDYNSLAANSTQLFLGGDRNQVQSFTVSNGARDNAFVVNLDGPQFAEATTLLVSGSNLLVGGFFTRVNDTPRQRFTSVSTTTGAVNSSVVQTYSHAPRTMTGPDSFSSGKLFVGGDFTSAGGVERRSVAALDAAGDVDPAFENNGLKDGFSQGDPARIVAMAFGNGRLYVGGDIREVDGEDRFGVFALNAATGAIDESFNGETGGPGGGEIKDLELRDGRLYAAGSFAEIGGAARRNLAALDPATGVPVPGFAPNPSHVSNFDDVAEIAIQGQRMYVGGRFDTIGGLARDWIAALDLSTGAVDPAFDLDLETTQTQPIRSLATDGTRVYVGGFFSSVNGFPRGNVAAVTADTGDTVVGWNVTAGSAVDDIAVAGDRVFVAGFFNQINGTTRRGFAAVSRSGGALDAWDPLVASPLVAGAPGSGNSIALAHGRIDMGGNFNRVDGRPRSAYLSVTTPMPVNSVAPAISGTPRAGQALTCSTGTWSNAPTFAFEWLRDGQPIAGATAATYALTASDAGRSISCRVTASNSDGTAEQASAAVAIDPPPPPPPADPEPAPPQPDGGTQPGGIAPPTGGSGPPRGEGTVRPAAARIVRSTVTLKKGVASLKLSCPSGGTDCTGTVTVTTSDRKRTKLGSARFVIKAGKTGTVKVKLARRVQASAARLKKVRVAAGEAAATLPLRVKR
jgi:hypothetical protein